MAYESLPISHDFEGSSDEPAVLSKIFKLFSNSNEPSSHARPSSPPAAPISSLSRPPHSRQLSATSQTASQKLGAIASAYSGDVGLKQEAEPRRPSPPRVASSSREGMPSQLKRSTTKSSIAPAIRSNKLSMSTAPSVRLLQTTSVHVDLSGRAYTHDERAPLHRTNTVSSDLSEAQGSPSYGFIPGFALPNDLVDDDAKSVSSFAGSSSSRDVLENVRRLQREGKGISKEFWLADEKAKYCYSCHSVFTIWRRKHHCRVCGQIFCAQCAQNMRPGAAYGYGSTMIRVCDICAAVYNRTKFEGRDDTRTNLTRSPHTLDRFPSIGALSMAPSIRGGISPLTISAPLEAQEGLKQSRFSASALFPKTEYLHFVSPLADGDGSPPTSPATPGFGSDREFSPEMSRRGSVPFNAEDDEVDEIDLPPISAKVPFRQTIVADEDQPMPAITDATESHALEAYVKGKDASEEEAGLGLSGLRANAAAEIDSLGLRKVTTADSSDGRRSEPTLPSSPRPVRAGRTRTNSRGAEQPFEGFTSYGPVAFQRNHSLRERVRRDSILRSLHGTESSSSYAELPPASLQYVKELLRQRLSSEDIAEGSEWEAELLPLLLKLSRHPTPAGREGDMNIRSLLRIKKIPGGRPRMSELIDGVVFTKNVMHKGMSRLVSSPRIVLISFAIEYSRLEGQFMSLEPLIQQEREYLRNLVHRILSHRPHVVLCEKSVARVALDEMHERGVVVAQNVKPGIIAALARCTQGDIISSMERLAANPRMGRCGTFRVQSFQHALIPGRRKTLLRFEGCAKDSGATIVLRGADYATLAKVKRIMGFLAAAVYGMRLERAYLWETHGLMPTRVSPYELNTGIPASIRFHEGVPPQIAELDQAVDILAAALQPFVDRLLSTSCLVTYPPPYPLRRLLEDVVSLRALRTRREDEEAARILREERGESMAEEATGGLSRSSTMSGISAISSDTSRAPSLTFDRDAFPRSSAGTSVLARTFSDQSLSSVAATAFVHASSSLAAPSTEGEIAETEAARALHARLFDVYKRSVPDMESSLLPEHRQHIVVLRSKVFPNQNRICQDPELRSIQFYGIGDVPLGQYIEEMLASIARKCDGKDCEEMNYLHFEAFVHGIRRIEFHLERGDTSDLSSAERLSVATYCPSCNRRTKTAPMSDLAWQYSFGKFLELGFYADNLMSDVEEAGCPHNLRDFQRYFLLRGFSVRCQIAAVSLCDVSVPGLRLRGKIDAQFRLRDEELRYMSRANTAFWVSVNRRINSYSSVLPIDKLENARESLAEMLKRAEMDRKAFEKLVHEARNSVDWPSADILNRVRASLNASTEAWDRRFRQFNDSVALGRESRSNIRRVFSDQSAPTSPEQSHMPTLQLPPPLETEENAAEGAEGQTLHARLSSPSLSSESTPLTTDALARLDATAPLRQSKTAPSSLRKDADGAESDSGSDSTVQADLPFKRDSTEYEATSGFDTDPGRVLKPPRRVKTTGTVEALVKKFDSPPSSKGDSSTSPEIQLSPLAPRSPTQSRVPAFSGSIGSSSARAGPSRPSLRRGKSEAGRPTSSSKIKDLDAGILSDGGQETRKGSKRRARVLSPSTPTSKIPTRRGSLAPPADQRPLASRSSSSVTVKAVPVASPRSSRPSSPAKARSASPVKTRPPPLTQSKTLAQRRLVSGASSAAESSESTTPLRGKRGATTIAAFSTVGPSRHPTRPPLPRKSSGPPTSNRAAGKVLNTVRQFERLSRDGYNTRRMPVRPRKARPMGISKPISEVFTNMKDALKDDSDEEHADDSGADDEYEADEPTTAKTHTMSEVSIETDATSSSMSNLDSSLVATQAFLSPPIDEHPLPSLPSVPSSPAPYTMDGPRMSRDYVSGSEMSSSEAGQRSIWKNLSLSSVQSGFSSLVASAVDELYPLEYPFFSTEHLFENNPVVIREDEPSSIIAHTLRSKDYTEKLRLRGDSTRAERADLLGAESDWTHIGAGEQEGTDAEELQGRLEAHHLGFHFTHENVRFDCRVFYADRFDALRRSAQCEEAFIESLTRCVRWETTGGKSGSTFLKTRDDRFIIKELSPSERDAFVKFADNYFRHLSRAFFRDVPTILAKIFGMFRISFKGPGRSARLDVLVMENVFYERKISRIYDLKGSMRNRKAPTTGQTQQVLLDENLVEEAATKPIYLRDQSKHLLAMALHNDTHFLAEQNVMDYSLVVGVDQAKQELVVGIIDFVRTYTWDKKLEHWIKNTNKREPTIVTPIQYKTRFRQAMSQYFLLVPDAWSVLPRPLAVPAVAEVLKTGVTRAEKEKSREREILIALPRAPLPPACRPSVPVS